MIVLSHSADQQSYSTSSFSWFTEVQVWTVEIHTVHHMYWYVLDVVCLCMCTYAALFHTMTSLSSPPDARYSPLLDQRTQFTHAAEKTKKRRHKHFC